MSANNTAAIQQAIDDICRILVLVHQAIANPTQASMDAIIATYGASSAQGLIPKPDTSQGGVSTGWVAYRKSLEESLVSLQKLLTILGPGAFWVRSHTRT